VRLVLWDLSGVNLLSLMTLFSRNSGIILLSFTLIWEDESAKKFHYTIKIFIYLFYFTLLEIQIYN